MAKQAKREAGVVALGVWLAVLAGCGESRGTGKHGELYIRLPRVAIAAGLTATIRIDDLRTWPENGDLVDAERVERWNFKDTMLEVHAPAGFDFEITFREAAYSYWAGGYELRTRCDAEPGIAHEIRVRMMAEGKARYEDAFELTCYEPTRLELRELEHPYAAPSEPGVGRYFVGGEIEAEVLLSADTPQGVVPVSGGGLVLTDSQGILRMGEPEEQSIRNTGFILEVIAPGVGPKISYRGASLRLPMEAVRDDGWRLELGTWQGPPPEQGYAERFLDAIARGSDGSELRGLQRCFWTTQQTGVGILDAGCRLRLWGAPASSNVCVTAYGRTTCGP